MIAAIAFATVVGLTIGSFLNVVIYRLPRGESVVHPRSRCPSCGHQLSERDNIPVVSWLLLRGKCRSCGAPISPRYPAVELATGVMFGGVVAIAWDDWARMALGLILVTALLPIALIDLEHRRIPNLITGPAAIALVIAGTALDPSGEPERLLAAAIVFVPFVLLALAVPRGFGMGDPKLMAVMALGLGRAVAPAIFFAFLTGTIVGLGIIAKYGRTKGRKMKVPFGPFLAAGAVVGWLWGVQIWDAYVGTFND